MHVGMAIIFQGEGKGRTDRNVYQNELRLGSLAEPLGFESLWGVEHHFTDYTMCPDVLQYLSYFAGRTEKIQLGSMVVVLPWHHPVRVAEQVLMLDHMSDGRFVFGIGRGPRAGRVRGLRRRPGGQPRDLRRVGPADPGGPRDAGTCEFEGEVLPAGEAASCDPRPFKSFRGRNLCGGGLARVVPDHGAASASAS